MMTDIAGILRDKNDPASLISEVTVEEIHGLVREGVISGGMLPRWTAASPPWSRA